MTVITTTTHFVILPNSIGSGCAGLAAAYHINKSAECVVDLFEADDHIGGHANTIKVAGGVEVDTGFMVYNELVSHME